MLSDISLTFVYFIDQALKDMNISEGSPSFCSLISNFPIWFIDIDNLCYKTCVSYILQLDVQNKRGRTALFNCMVTGNIETAQVLLRHGANPALKGQLTENRSKIR